MKPYSGPPMTLGNAASARVRLVVWCRACRHRVEPDPVEMAERYDPETTVLEWRERLVCSKCGSHDTDMVVTGTERRWRCGASAKRGICGKMTIKLYAFTCGMVDRRFTHSNGRRRGRHYPCRSRSF
jgi:hypothetical protein